MHGIDDKTLVDAMQSAVTPAVFARLALQIARGMKMPDGFAEHDYTAWLKCLQQRAPDVFLRLLQFNDLNIAMQNFFCTRWVSYGMPTFEMSEDLVAGLTQTDSSAVRLEDVRPPFPAFLIGIPSRFWSVREPSVVEHTAQMKEKHYTHPEIEKAIKYYQKAFGSNQGEDVRCILVLWDYAGIDRQRKLHKSTCFALMSESGTSTFSNMLLSNRTTSGDVLQQHDFSNKAGGTLALSEDEKTTLRCAWHTVVNLCLYVAENGRGERKKSLRARACVKRVRNKKRKKQKPEPAVWVLGKHVKLPREVVNAAKLGLQAGQWKVGSRFTVRGHWRNQACGPRLSRRKLIWIQPHWKGEGPRVSHLYDLDC